MHDPRDLEWQRRYEQNDTPWDKGAPAPALMEYLNQNRMAGRVLVPGCGRGHEVRALARQPDVSVVGLDFAPDAIAQARQLASQSVPEADTNFMLGDFLNLPTELENSFDWLVEHTCFCAIDPILRPDYVRAAASALRAGGKIFGIFYLNPDTENGPPFAVSREELARLFNPHFSMLAEWVPKVSFAGREERELVMVLQKR